MKLDIDKIKNTDFLKYVIVNDLIGTEGPEMFMQVMYENGVKRILAGAFADANEYKVIERADGLYLDCAVGGEFTSQTRTRINMSEFFTSEEETDVRPCPPSFCPKMGDTVFEDGYKRTYFGFVEGNHFYIHEDFSKNEIVTIYRGGEPQEFLKLTLEEAIGYIAMQQGLTTEQIKLTP